jgi:hypothetical protein
MHDQLLTSSSLSLRHPQDIVKLTSCKHDSESPSSCAFEEKPRSLSLTTIPLQQLLLGVMHSALLTCVGEQSKGVLKRVQVEMRTKNRPKKERQLSQL